jgi:Coenzyme PQQ synthesis protein D (PqqD)
MMKINEGAKLPAARAEDLIVQKMADEVLVYDQQRHQAHCLNQTAALVWRALDGESTAGEVAARLSQQEGVEIGTAVVEMAVAELSRSGLLAAAVEAKSGLSRREMMKRVGVGAAVALPVVVSVVAPRAAQAATLLPPGSPCSSPAQCSSGICQPNNTCL